MRWIVTGSGGQLGQSLVRQLREVLSPAEVLAAACAGAGARFVHVSTDYVFDGRGEAPYAEDYPTEPNTAYGRTKLVGEQRVMAVDPEALIARTSWVFGPGKNFVAAILRQARLRRTGEVEGPLSVVDDQQGCPTYAADLAAAVRALVAKEAHGIFHVSNRGATTWWDFARAILDETGYSDLVIERGRTAILNLPAERPAYSVLDCSRAASLGVTLRSWEEALREYLESEDSPALVGVQAGHLSGGAQLINQHANGTTHPSNEISWEIDISRPQLNYVVADGSSLGGFIDFVGSGFVGSEPGELTEVTIDGTFQPDGGGAPKTLQLNLVTEFDSSSRVRYILNEDDELVADTELIAYRGLFLIDKNGVVQHQLVNNLPLGRNVDEAIRMVDALTFVEENGEVCPANWAKGKEAMKPSHEGTADYLAKN